MSPLTIILLLASCASLSVCRPAEEPTKISINTEGQTTGNGESKITSMFQQGKDIVGRVADGIRIGRGKLVNSITLARNIIVDRAEQFASDARNNVASVIAAKTDVIDQKRSVLESFQKTLPAQSSAVTRDSARLENESAQGLLEKPIQKPVEQLIQNFVKPVPLVDRIKEEEKYGNSGDKFIGIGRALVGGFEGLSNLLNSILDLPGNLVKKTSRKITENLNNVGAKLVGLQ